MRYWLWMILLLASGCLHEKQSIHEEQGQDFFYLLGKDTSRWKYVRDRDANVLSFFSQLYEQRKDLQFQPLDYYKIPKKIHLIWLGPKSFPIESLDTIRSWIALHLDWEIYFWTDRERIIPVQGLIMRSVNDFEFSKLKQYFELSTNWAEKADILRFEILAKEGGVYIDHDAFCLKNFDNLNKAYDFYSCLEAPHPEIDGYAITSGIGIIGAKTSHPVILGAIDHIENHWDEMTRKFSTDDDLSKMERVMHRTYIALTHSILKNLPSSHYTDIVFPASYFYPMENMEGIYSKHLYATSWNFYGDSTKQEFTHSKMSKPDKKFTQVVNMYTVLSISSLLVLGLGTLLLRRRSS